MPRWVTLAPLLAAFLAGSNPAGAVNRPLASAELIRRGPDFAQLRSFLAIGRFHLEHGRPDRARQILLYGLLHAPSNPELLAEAARAELRLGRLEDALELAQEAQRIEPTSERAWTLTEIRHLLATRAAAATASATQATPASAPAPAASPPPVAPPGELAGKTRALHLVVALEAAVKGFNAGKKKSERMTKFDLDMLKKEHFVPDDFSLASFKVSKMTTEGQITLEEFGTVGELKPLSAEYEAMSTDISRRLRDGALNEAAFRLREMSKKFPKEPAVRARLLYTLRAQGLILEALKEVELSLAASPSDPALGYEKTMLLLETGHAADALVSAEKLAATTGAGIHAILARRLATLVRQGVPRELEQDLKSAASSAQTTPTTASRQR